MTEAELYDAALAQAALSHAAHRAAQEHPLVLAITNLISAHQAVTLNGAPLDILKSAQSTLATALSQWMPVVNHTAPIHD